MKKRNLILSASLLACSTLSAQIIVNFEDANSLDALTSTSTGSQWSLSPTGGNNGGYLASTGDNAYSVLNTALTLNTSTDNSFSISIDFLTSSGNNLSSRRSLVLGLSDSSIVNYEGGGNVLQTTVQSGLFPDSANGSNNFRYFSATSNPDVTDGISVGSNDNLLNNTWYNLTSNWTYSQSTDTFDISLVVTQSGSSSPLRTVGIGTDIANPFGGSSTIYAFFGGRDTLDTNIAGVDNFQISGDIVNSVTPVPEPSHYAALVGFLTIAFVAYRRRKHTSN